MTLTYEKQNDITAQFIILFVNNGNNVCPLMDSRGSKEQVFEYIRSKLSQIFMTVHVVIQRIWSR